MKKVKTGGRISLNEKATQIVKGLERAYPRARCSLEFNNPLELLIATILSAQCTDKRVNEVTKTLFKKYKTPQDYVQAPLAELEEDIRPTGFFHNKAKNIQGCCRDLLKHHQGKIPRTMEELVALPGIGRKTANVVLGNAFGVPGIVVDTHVGRIAQRLGLTREKDPVKIEFALMPLIPEKHWTVFSHQMIEHGRSLCTARAPQCPACFLRPFCDFGMLETNHPLGERS
jgi:endonuclease III